MRLVRSVIQQRLYFSSFVAFVNGYARFAREQPQLIHAVEIFIRRHSLIQRDNRQISHIPAEGELFGVRHFFAEYSAVQVPVPAFEFVIGELVVPFRFQFEPVFLVRERKGFVVILFLSAVYTERPVAVRYRAEVNHAFGNVHHDLGNEIFVLFGNEPYAIIALFGVVDFVKPVYVVLIRGHVDINAVALALFIRFDK